MCIRDSIWTNCRAKFAHTCFLQKKFIQEKAQIWQYKCHIKTVCPKCKDSAISKKKGLYQQSNRNRYAPGCRTSCQYGNKSSPYCIDVYKRQIPVNPPEFGMITQRTFFIMFPLHLEVICSGSFPKTSRALAAPYASAIGSVHPLSLIHIWECHHRQRFHMPTAASARLLLQGFPFLTDPWIRYLLDPVLQGIAVHFLSLIHI